MIIEATSLSPEETYRLLSGVVVPRPIAWVLTRTGDGVDNLAPFSCFTFVSNKPPMLGINMGRKKGARKDSRSNIDVSGEYVVHIPTARFTDAVHTSAKEFPAEVSEVKVLGLETVASAHVSVPRLRNLPLAMECRFHSAVAYGDTGAEFVVGEVLAFHVDDRIYADGKIDTALLDPIARIGGPKYSTLGEITTLTAIEQTPKSVIPS
ncbi:flavin reductase family protein [Brevibacterium sp. CCUG 69071]|uniref:flavin reductase family protein n=1 Tax=Brevibacterium sp. CCUG 69071 TaxID=2052937 RepID=UPI001E3D82DF|nr:flavin reductase family protein [Brevibacterium sp. CCUG 69071]MCD1287648.1 flavin reductase family protein [Brevibacterium sp. CCUG 69071]